MSSTAYESPLYAVPDMPSGAKSRFAFLLALRDAARRAFDKAVSLPRSAIRWAISLFQRWADAAADTGVFSWLGQHARTAAGIVRAAGVVPVAVAALSIPPVAAAATRLVRFVGQSLRRVASAAWSGLKDLLGRCGTTGTRITEGLSRAGAKVASWVRAAAQHPVMEPIAQALRATLALVRPVSQGFVAHRLLSALVPILWLRAAIELLLMPLLVDNNLAGSVGDFVFTPTSQPTPYCSASTGNGSDGTHSSGSHTGPLIDAFGPATHAPLPSNGSVPTEGAPADEEPPLNRAARRAQQRDDAQVKRTRPHR